MEFLESLTDNNDIFFLIGERKKLLRKDINNVKKLSIKDLYNFTKNINYFIIILSVYSSRIVKLIEEYSENINDGDYDDFLTKLYDIISKFKSNDVPSLEDKGIISFLYFLAELSIETSNIRILEYVSKCTTFEHTHVRIALMFENEEIIKVVKDNYDGLYEMSELKG